MFSFVFLNSGVEWSAFAFLAVILLCYAPSLPVTPWGLSESCLYEYATEQWGKERETERERLKIKDKVKGGIKNQDSWTGLN